MMEFQVGDVVDRRYLLKRPIARGGMSAIFEAEHLHTGRRLVIKSLLGELGQDASARKRLLREGKALERCRGRSIVDVLDVGVDGEQPFLALELLDGRSLDGLLAARTRLPLAVAVEVLAELCLALEVVHRSGLIHRDVKPSNLFVVRGEGSEERLKLLDFGIVRFPDEEVPEKITGAGEQIGTREYMSPEQLFALPTDARSDLFSAMVVFFECVTGELPFPKGLYDQPPPLLSRTVAGFPPALDEVLTRGLAQDRNQRFSSASALARAVRRAAGALPSSSLLDDMLPVAAPQRRTFPRAPYITMCRAVVSDQMVFDGRSADLSEGGMLALFPVAPPPGQRVLLRFCLPISGRAINVSSVPRWQRTARFQTAVGLEFNQFPDEAHQEIRRFVQLMGQEASPAPEASAAPPPDPREAKTR